MQIKLESEDMTLIIQGVVQELKPLLSNGKEQDNVIFTVESLAEYLQVPVSDIYKKKRSLPHFKFGKYLRFKKADIDRWLKAESVQPVNRFTPLASIKRLSQK